MSAPTATPAITEPVRLEVNLDGLALGVRALRTALQLAPVQADEALQRSSTPRGGRPRRSPWRVGSSSAVLWAKPYCHLSQPARIEQNPHIGRSWGEESQPDRQSHLEASSRVFDPLLESLSILLYEIIRSAIVASESGRLPRSGFNFCRLPADEAGPIVEFSHRASRAPVLVLRPVEPVPDERPDRDPADFERHLLEVDLDGLVLGIRALRTKLDVALIFPEVALQRHLVPEPGYDHLSVLRIGLGFDPDHRAGHKAEPIQGIPLDPDEEIGLATESFCHRSWYPRCHPLLCQNGLARGDTTSNDEGEVVVEEPDVARAPGLELNPGLAFQAKSLESTPDLCFIFNALAISGRLGANPLIRTNPLINSRVSLCKSVSCCIGSVQENFFFAQGVDLLVGLC